MNTATTGVRPVKRQMEVPENEWQSVQAGDVMTVLYDPRRAGHGVLYRFAEYEVA